MRYDLVIVGGGPAGTSAAITAARAGKRVLVLERGRFPRHKVCGEFVSAESHGLLAGLLRGTAGERLVAEAPALGQARIFVDGKVLRAPVEPAAFSLPRFLLDEALWKAAQAAGVECCGETVVRSVKEAAAFEVECEGATFAADALIDATGRWSNLRTQPPPRGEKWIGVKAHFREAEPSQTTDLYFFRGGYCGVQPVGVDAVNACALVRADVASTLEQVFTRSPELARRSRGWQMITEPVSTSPVFFRAPQPLRGRVICAGDAAGFIDPFAGDGIAIALRTGAQAATLEPAAYAAWYEREIVPAFRAAARLRKMLGLPSSVRKAALAVLGHKSIAAWAVRTTRSRVAGA